MNVIDDLNPELGGNLNLNGFCLTDGTTAALTFYNKPFMDVNVITTATGQLFFQTTSTCIANGPIPDISAINLCVSKGSLLSPQNTTAGDALGVWNVCGYFEGDWKNSTGIISMWGDTANLNDNQPTSKMILQTGAGGDKMNYAFFDERGVLTVPVFSATTYTTDALPVNPSAGWMVFDNITKQFKGWNGTEWVVLG